MLLTDVKLAVLPGQAEGAKVRHGTPAYMAHEQLADEEVTVRSDLYSLGLVRDLEPAEERAIQCARLSSGIVPFSIMSKERQTGP